MGKWVTAESLAVFESQEVGILKAHKSRYTTWIAPCIMSWVGCFFSASVGSKSLPWAAHLNAKALALCSYSSVTCTIGTVERRSSGHATFQWATPQPLNETFPWKTALITFVAIVSMIKSYYYGFSRKRFVFRPDAKTCSVAKASK